VIVLTASILYLLIVVPGTSGEMCMSRAMKIVGEVTDFNPLAIARAMGRVLKVSWFWIGIALMTTGFFALLAMLSVAKVSFVFPATALSYAVGTLGGKLFLRERVSQQRWLGVLVVCLGVLLVALGKAPENSELIAQLRGAEMALRHGTAVLMRSIGL
jgi:drug/metabolite transporter (DMT)-like permease